MTTMVLTMPRQMKGTSYVLLIAFLACFLPLGQFSTVSADDDDRGAWEFFADVCKVIAGVTIARDSYLVAAAGVGVIATTGWSGVGSALGGGAVVGGVTVGTGALKVAMDSANNVANDIADLFD